jgi:hypothetical protein
MPDNRPPIPAALERDLMIEAGYRCAVCKATDPLEIDHITDWAIVQKHAFENMIVLCANCHGRKKDTSSPRHINRASLQKIKSNLMLLNGRYSDLERRIIEEFRKQLIAKPDALPSIFIPDRLNLLVRYLIQDGLVTGSRYESSLTVNFPDGIVLRDDNLRLTLTEGGRQFIGKLYPDLGSPSVQPQPDAVTAETLHMKLAGPTSFSFS